VRGNGCSLVPPTLHSALRTPHLEEGRGEGELSPME